MPTVPNRNGLTRRPTIEGCFRIFAKNQRTYKMSEETKKVKHLQFANHVVMMFVVISKEAIALFYFKISLDEIEALVVA